MVVISLTHGSELHGNIQVSVLCAVIRCLLQSFHPGFTQPGNRAVGAGGRGKSGRFHLLLLLHTFSQDLLQREDVLLAVLGLKQQPPQDVPAEEEEAAEPFGMFNPLESEVNFFLFI